MLQLALAIEAFLENGCALVVVRAKDRFSNPTSFGYMDLLLNVRLKEGRHVGELQIHLERIHAIKPACHRTYALLRQVRVVVLSFVSCVDQMRYHVAKCGRE